MQPRPSLNESAPRASHPLTIRFTEWHCGHHGQRPADIPVQSIDQANLILQAIACAISQPGHARAAVFDEDSGVSVYLTDDSAEPVKPFTAYHDTRTTVFYGSAAELEQVRSKRLQEALEWELGGLPTIWTGKGELSDLEVLTILTREEIEAATSPVEWYEEGKRRAVCLVPPVLTPMAELIARLEEEAAAAAGSPA